MGQITDVEAIQRAVVLQVLRDDREQQWWTFDELQREISDTPREVLREAIGLLSAAGVVENRGHGVRATRPARCLDTLGLVAI